MRKFKEYYEISDIKSCSKWITVGFDYLKKDSIKKENNKLHYYCLKYYKFAISELDRFEEFSEKTFIPYLKENSKEMLLKYSQKLSEYYRERRIYKKALYYLNIANSIYNSRFII